MKGITKNKILLLILLGIIIAIFDALILLGPIKTATAEITLVVKIFCVITSFVLIAFMTMYGMKHFYEIIGAASGGLFALLIVIIVAFSDSPSIQSFLTEFAVLFAILNIITFLGCYLSIYAKIGFEYGFDNHAIDDWIIPSLLLGTVAGFITGFTITGELIFIALIVIGFVIGFGFASLLSPPLGLTVGICWSIWFGYDLWTKIIGNTYLWLIEPLFLAPLFAIIGYLSFKFTLKIFMEKRELQHVIQDYKLKMEGWRNDGYDLSEIEQMLK